MHIVHPVTGAIALTLRGLTMQSLARCAAILLIVATLTGCGGSGMFGDAMSPSEAAEAAFNPYDADARRRAVTQLANADWGGQPPYLRTYRLLLDDPDPTVRAAALTALGLHGGITDVPRIASFLDYRSDGEPTESAKVVRWEAAKALQKIHDRQAVDALVDALSEDSDVDVRLAAANALGQYDSRSAFDALVTALRDDDYAVVKEVHQALTTVTGADQGNRARDWWQWAEDNTDSLFAKQQPYHYPQYVPPEGVLSKMAFWSEPPKLEPKRPRREKVAMNEDGEVTGPRENDRPGASSSEADGPAVDIPQRPTGRAKPTDEPREEADDTPAVAPPRVKPRQPRPDQESEPRTETDDADTPRAAERDDARDARAEEEASDREADHTLGAGG